MSRETAFKRLFENVYVCMECGAKRKASYQEVSEGKVKCRKCGSKELRKKGSENRG